MNREHIAFALREAWLARRQVRVSLSKRSAVHTVVGRVTLVSVTGGDYVIDGWHIPLDEIDGMGVPTLGDVESYAQEMHRLREEAGYGVAG